ncbi:MAG: hypothetical protein KBB21_28885 [Nannocystaceae bacterium]|jgi:hypothetical protein|nr:hypothetical protein [Deltaproteobacteria bacterium]MBK8719464.1 hypothetical protein [Deltaproteobacteria bacterium]MBP7290675.1 hypothetical protein [Nannocystaceae bacterium]
MTDPEEPQDDVAPAPSATVATDDETSDLPDEESDYGPPFSAKTFGGSFVWARGEQYVASVLRVKEGENVVVSTANRRDMNVMLTGGRAVLEVDDGSDSDRVELLPAAPVFIDPGKNYRLVAMTEVELFTVYSPMN